MALCTRSVAALGAGWSGTRPRIRGSGCGWLVALGRPVLAVADRASSIAPIGVQLVKYVLHLLNGTGRPTRGARCPHRKRRGSGAGRPPWLWPPGRSPERNRGHRCQKDKGQRNVRRDQVPHNALPQLWTVMAGARLTVNLHRSVRHVAYGPCSRARGVRLLSLAGRDEPVSRARASALARTTSRSRASADGSSVQARSRRILGLPTRMRFITRPAAMSGGWPRAVWAVFAGSAAQVRTMWRTAGRPPHRAQRIRSAAASGWSPNSRATRWTHPKPP